MTDIEERVWDKVSYLEGKVKRLEKENAEQKEEMEAKQVVLNDFKLRVETVTDRFNRKSSQLTRAIEIILNLLNNFAYPIGQEDWTVEDVEVVNKAEQFLKEVE